MIKKLSRLAAIVLVMVMIVQMVPYSIILTFEQDDSKNNSDTVSDYIEETIDVDEIDFSTKRLLVGTDDPSIFTEDANVINSYGDVYLLDFEDESEAKEAYTYYSEIADFVDADIAMFLADDDFIAEEQAEDAESDNDLAAAQAENAEADNDLADEQAEDAEADNSLAVDEEAEAVEEQINALPDAEDDNEKTHYDIAIIDSGVANGAAGSVSVIGGDGVDDNGHGTAMFTAVKSVSDTVSVLSIKAFDSHGIGYLFDIYAAMMVAIDQDVDVISLSFSAESKSPAIALKRAVAKATDKGIIVVGAAGNDNADVSAYLPGRLENVIIAGACDEEGVRLPTSSYGKNVLCNVVAGSTSEAAAKLSALIAAYGEDYVTAEMNNGVIFDKDYGLPDGNDPLVETDPSDSELLDKSQLQDTTLDAIDKPVAVADEPDTEEPEDDGDDIDWSIPPEQEPVTKDNTTIEGVYVRWLTASTGEETPAYFGTLNLAPVSETVTDQQFQIDFALSGQEAYEPGMIELVFPASIWEDRNGEEPGYITLAVPEDPSEGAEFVWKRVDDKIVITNAMTMSAASKVMIQGSFRGLIAPDMVDEVKSALLSVTLTVETPLGNEISMTSNEIRATIDTSVKVTYANKTAYNSTSRTYDVWPDQIPPTMPTELIPADEVTDGSATKYVYIRWYVSGTASGSQPFQMYVEDTVAKDEESGEPLYGGIMLGVSDSAQGTVKSTDGESVKALLYDGYSLTAKTAYVWTAYPVATFPQEVTDIPNTQRTTVIGKDDGELSWEEASAVVKTKAPTEYTFVKVWKDPWDGTWEGSWLDVDYIRPTRLDLNIYYDGRLWKTIRLDESYSAKDDAGGHPNYWTYTWSDGGRPGNFTVSEKMYDYSGVYESRFDGTGHRLEWNYILYDTDYNSDTHTWTYTNMYDEGWIKFEISELDKQVEYNFRDSALVSTRDSLSLNRLLRDEEIIVKYPVAAKISVAKPAVWFNVRPNKFVLEDAEYILNNNKSLTVNDVNIHAVTLTKPVVWHYIDNSWDENGWYQREIVATPTATLYGLKGELNEADDETKWIALATIDNDGTVQIISGSGASLPDRQTEPTRVLLPNGISRVKLELDSPEAVVDMSYTIELRVNPTEDVLAMIKDGFENDDYLRFSLYNRANAYATYQGTDPIKDDWKTYQTGDLVTNMNATATGYLHGRQFRVATDLNKDFTLTENDTNNRRVTISTTLTLMQQSNVPSRLEYNEALENGEIPNTNSGIFYDLLPIGVDPDLSTLMVDPIPDPDAPLDNSDPNARQVMIGTGIVEDFWTYENYKDTGRTLLVVKVTFTEDHINYVSSRPSGYPTTYPSTGYNNSHTLTFDSTCSYITLLSNATGLNDMRNIAAYEADESIIGTYPEWSGEPDDPLTENQHVRSSEAVGAYGDIMTDLDPDRDEYNFVYAGAPLSHNNPDMRSVAGLEKDVSITGSNEWSKGLNNDVNVQEGGLYSYRLSITSASDTVMSELVLVDSIENYQPHDKDAAEDKADTPWRGTLLSVDLSAVKAAGIAPVVYYSTTVTDVSNYADSTLEGTTDALMEKLANEDEWTTDTTNLDMSKVTAIAIDMRYDTDGEPFKLSSGKSLAVYLHMRAPYDLEDDSPYYFKGTDGKDHLQNGHAFNDVYLNCLQEITGSNTHAYINYSYTKVGIFTSYLDIQKAWDDDDDRDGIRPGSVTVKLYADGQYTGQSVTLNDDNEWKGRYERLLTYNDDGTYIRYTFVEEGMVEGTYTPQVSRTVDEDGNVLITITNVHPPETINIPVHKTWLNDNNNEDGLRPRYIRVTLYANGVYAGQLYIYPDVNGDWSGEFTDLLKYHDGGEEIEYTIEEEPVDNYKPEGLPEGDYHTGFEVTNRYDPYGDLRVTKQLENTTDKSSGADFTFTLLLMTENDGTEGDDDEVPVNDKFEYVILENGEEIDSGTIGHGNEFTLKGGQTIHIKNIPAHVHYTVIENSTRNFTASSENADGSIVSWAPTDAIFTNTYNASGAVTLYARKVLEGRALRRSQFRFDVYENNTRIRMQYNDENGLVTFGQIGYTIEDEGKEFIYRIEEYNAGNSGYTYDAAQYWAKVIPHDNGDGTMSCEVHYYSDADCTQEIETDVPTFENEYKASGSLRFRAWKVLDGRSVKANEFTFDLYDENFTHLETVKNNGEGQINFSQFNFVQDREHDVVGVHWYYAREQKGNDSTVVYTDTIFGYKIVVVDYGNGTLGFEQYSYDMTDAFIKCADCEGTGKADGADCGACHGFGYILDEDWEEPEDSVVPVFTNGLVDGALTVSKYISGSGEGYDPDQEFTFKIKLIGDKIEDGEYVFEKTVAPKREFPDTSGIHTVDPSAFTVSAERESAAAADDGPVMPLAVYTGDLDTNLTWSLDTATGVLNISPTNGSSATWNANYTSYNSSPWYNYRTYVKSVVTEGEITVSGTLNYLFSANTSLNNISGLAHWDVSGVTSMYYLFSGCASLSDIYPLEDWDVSNVINMGYMFAAGTNAEYGSILSDLNPLADWTVSSVTNMSDMFYGAKKLSSTAPLKNWKTTSVKYMDHMFRSCSILTDLSGLKGWDVSNVERMNNMFQNCSNLTDLSPLADWNVTSVLQTSSMFWQCTQLGDLTPLSEWRLSSATDINYMFASCGQIISLDGLENWTVSNVSNMNGLFTRSTAIVDASALKDWDVSRVSNMGAMFQDCSNLEIVDFSGWKLKSVTNGNAFYGCNNLWKVTIGPETEGLEKLPYFSDPPTSTTTGFWINENEADWSYPSETYTTEQILHKTEPFATPGTYIWQYRSGAYIINFEPDDKYVDGSMSYRVADRTSDYTLPPNQFKMLGNPAFIGWQDKNDASKTFLLNGDGKCIIPQGTYAAKNGEQLTVTLIPMWEKDEHNFEIKDSEFTFTLKGGERAYFRNLPAGTAYQVWEETPEGWILIQQSGVSGVIQPTVTAEAEFYNLYQPEMTAATIIGTKLYDNRPADQDNKGNAFEFELWEGDTLLQTKAASSGGFILFDTIFYTEEGTHTYTVREKVGGNADIKYDSHVETVTVTVTRTQNGLSATVAYDESGIRFENNTVPGSLEISKIAQNEPENSVDPDFTFKVTLYNENGVPVDGESFKWYVVDSETGEMVKGAEDSSDPDEDVEPTEPVEPAEPTETDSAISRLMKVALAAVSTVADIDLDNPVATVPDTEDSTDYPIMPLAATPLNYHGSGTLKGDTIAYDFDTSTGVLTLTALTDHATLKLVGPDGTVTSDSYQTNSRYGLPWERAYGSVWTMGDYITTIKTEGTIYLEGDASYFFAQCGHLTDISSLANWDVSGVTNFSNFFSGANYRGDRDGGQTSGRAELLSLEPLKDWDVSGAEDLSNMFYNCRKITDLTPLAGWDVSNATNLSGLFRELRALTSLKGLEDWETGNVTDISSMFYNCYKLRDISALAGWDMGNLEKASNLFYCYDSANPAKPVLQDLTPLAGWDVHNLKNASGMFSFLSYYPLNITGFDQWNTESLENASSMFREANLTNLEIFANWNMRKAQNISSMFSGVAEIQKLTTADFSNWQLDSVTNLTDFLALDYSYPYGYGGSSSRNTTPRISKVILGQGFFANLENWESPLTLEPYTYSPYTGYWIREEDWYAVGASHYGKTEIVSAGTYVWEKYHYQIDFDPGEGTGSMLSQVGYYNEATILRPNNFVYSGHVFVGWQDQNGKVFEMENGVCTIQSSAYSTSFTLVKLTAMWVPSGESGVPYYVNIYQQTVDDTDRYLLAESRVFYGEPGDHLTVDAPDCSGFHLRADQPDYREADIPTGDSVLYVDFYYDRDHYTVVFDGNGAEFGSMASRTLTGGIDVILGNGFTKTSSVFLGWNTAKDGGGQPVSAVAPVRDLTGDGQTIILYAQWMTIDQEVTPSQGVIYVTCKAGQTIIIPDLPAGTTYEIEEVDLPNGWTYVSSRNAKGTIRANTASQSSVTNTYSAKGTASIRAYKKMNGASLEAGDYTFELWEGTGNPLNIKYSHTPNVADDGTYSEPYAPNFVQRDVITIPGATSLLVQFMYQTQVIGGNDFIYIWEGEYTGEIPGYPDASTASAKYINCGPTYQPTLSNSLTISGDTVTIGFYSHNTNKQYQFDKLTDLMGYYAVITDGGRCEYVSTATNGSVDTREWFVDENNQNVVNEWYGYAPVTFAGIEYTKPGTYVYQIIEKAGTDSTVVYDGHVETVTVEVTDNGDGTLSAEVIYDDDGPIFTNSMDTGELTVSKTLQNATGLAAEKEFEFTIKLKNSSGNPLTGSYTVVKSEIGADGKLKTIGTENLILNDEGVGGPITLKGGQTFTVQDLPHGAQYTVTEADEDGFVQVSASGVTGTITGGSESSASFTNMYVATADLVLTARKNFVGGTIEADTFWFELISVDTGRVLQTVSAGTDGKIEFVPINYSQEDVGKTFTYMIRETIPEGKEELDGVVYDTHTETITVTVSNDTNGNITVTADKSFADLVFTNVALLDMTVSKEVTGNRGDQTKEFDFVLTLTNDDCDLSGVKWTTEREGGDLILDENHQYAFTLRHGETITFKNLPYGTVYEISEVVDDDSRLYDTTVTTTVPGEPTEENPYPANKVTKASGKVTSGVVESTITIDYLNEYDVVTLPTFGGIGTMPFYLSGVALLIVSAWLYYRLKRRSHCLRH